MKCPECKAVNPEKAIFCMACGVRLKAENTQSVRLRQLQNTAPQGLRRKMQAAREQLTGERKPVTILFTDIVGSTAIAETMDPEDWREVVAGAHRHVSEAIYKYEGTITQLLGDGVYAFFGAPITHEDDPERAVLAALELQKGIAVYRTELQGAAADLQLRVGINTGEVVIGDIGNDLHVEYLAFGDAVNLAARLETAAEPGTILVSRSTHEMISHQFETAALDPIRLKGIREPQRVFRILGERSQPVAALGIEEVRTPLVGRGQALDIFDLALRELREGKGKVLFTVGEAGLGKSRLIAESRNSNLARGLSWIEGRCQSYEAKTPYRLWTSALGVLCDLDPSADPAQQMRQLDAYIQRICPDQRDRTLPYFGVLFGWEQEIRPVNGIGLTGSDLQAAIFNAVEILITATTAHQPTVWVCEDLHWADPSSIELLKWILRLPARHPLLMICVLRPDPTSAAWTLREKVVTSGEEHVLEVALDPLTEMQSIDLVQHLLDTNALPEDLVARIIRRAEGNPFYIEEIIRSLIDTGTIVLDRDTGIRKIKEGLEKLPLPDSLNAVLLARIDRLPDPARRTLDLASVVGRQFDLDLLRSIVGRMQEGFMVGTELLVERRFLRPVMGEAGHTFVFNHALMQEAVYNVLLKSKRRRLHSLVGITIEDIYSSELERWFEPLAFHYMRAEEWTKAWIFNRAAGRKAKDQFANMEAIGFLLAAIAVSDQVEGVEIHDLIQTTFDLGEIQANINLYKEALESLSECHALTERLTSRTEKQSWKVRLDQKKGQILRSMGEYERAEAAINEGLEIVQEDNRVQRGALKVNLASIFTRQGKYAEAREICLEGIKDLETVGDRVELAHAYSLLGTIQRDSGDTEGSLNYRKHSLELSEAVGSLPLQVEAHNNLAVAFYDAGKYSEAVHHYQKSRDLSDHIGNMNTRARAEINLGEIQIIQGDWDLAEEAILSALEIWEGTGYTLGQAYGSCILGNLYVHRESPEEALTCLERSLALFLDLGAKGFLPAIYRLIAHANYLQGDLEQAETNCERAFDLAEELEMNQDLAVILRLQGRLCMEQGDLEAAEEKLGRSVALLSEMNLPYEQARSLCERARLRKAQGQNSLAKEDLIQAITTFESLQARIDLDRAQTLFVK